jgi:O-methyltransferase involved in polyketide biosynthesis
VSSSGRVSPTAHYTGYVWVRNGLSHPQLATREGRLMFESLRPAMIASRALGGPSLESYLLARHLAIDALLERAVDAGVTQVIEVACGLSPRGWRFTSRYGGPLTYIEGDLPAMAERKREALKRMGSLSEHHRVEVVDALLDDGPDSLAALARRLEPDRGLAIITEGLLGYLDRGTVEGIWRRFARALAPMRDGRYISDLHLAGVLQTAQVRAFGMLLSTVVRGRVHAHFESAEQATAALTEAGFESGWVHPATALAPQARGPGSDLSHILEASIE